MIRIFLKVQMTSAYWYRDWHIKADEKYLARIPHELKWEISLFLLNRVKKTKFIYACSIINNTVHDFFFLSGSNIAWKKNFAFILFKEYSVVSLPSVMLGNIGRLLLTFSLNVVTFQWWKLYFSIIDVAISNEHYAINRSLTPS